MNLGALCCLILMVTRFSSTSTSDLLATTLVDSRESVPLIRRDGWTHGSLLDTQACSSIESLRWSTDDGTDSHS